MYLSVISFCLPLDFSLFPCAHDLVLLLPNSVQLHFPSSLVLSSAVVPAESGGGIFVQKDYDGTSEDFIYFALSHEARFTVQH